MGLGRCSLPEEFPYWALDHKSAKKGPLFCVFFSLEGVWMGQIQEHGPFLLTKSEGRQAEVWCGAWLTRSF